MVSMFIFQLHELFTPVQKELQNLKDASDDLMLIDDEVIPYPVCMATLTSHKNHSEHMYYT